MLLLNVVTETIERTSISMNRTRITRGRGYPGTGQAQWRRSPKAMRIGGNDDEGCCSNIEASDIGSNAQWNIMSNDDTAMSDQDVGDGVGVFGGMDLPRIRHITG